MTIAVCDHVYEPAYSSQAISRHDGPAIVRDHGYASRYEYGPGYGPGYGHGLGYGHGHGPVDYYVCYLKINLIRKWVGLMRINSCVYMR